MVASQDASVMGGSLGEMHANKIVKTMRMALQYGCPFIAINDSGGARIQEGVDSLGGYARIFDANCESSGVIPQLSVIMGPCAGGAVYSPALTDFVFMTENSYMFITGPDVVKSVMQENVSLEELGGGQIHSQESGVCHFLTKDDRECLMKVRNLLSFMPANNQEDPPYVQPVDDPNRRCPELEQLVPADPNKAYDVRSVIAAVVDDGRFFEVHQLWAENMVVGFARLNGWVVGIIANQPMVLAGCIDIKASIKAAHFIRICDAYNVPLITLQDVPGFLPGKDQEYGGIIRNGARMIYAYSEATVPKLMVILRKSYGGAYCVMSSKGLRGDLLYAWPNAEIAVMGAEGAVNILFRNEVKNAPDPDARRKELVEDYQRRFNNPYVAAARGLIDDVIEPRDTRRVLIKSLEFVLSKRERHIARKHGISPA
jgi:propionyl-CoA carboxylase beta chain